MSTSTIESVKTFLLAYSHSELHPILLNDPNDPALFVWDHHGTTGTLHGVLRCDRSAPLENVAMTWDGNVWTGSYQEHGKTLTLTISDFTHNSSQEEISGRIRRAHDSDSGTGNDDMGSFTGTKT